MSIKFDPAKARTNLRKRVLAVVHTQRDERTRLSSARKARRGEADRYHA